MILVTSYFANIRNLGKFIPVGIAQWPPKWFAGESIRRLAPPEGLIRAWKAGGMTETEYVLWYTKEILDTLPEARLVRKAFEARGDRLALCCYEKPGDFCHRHLLAARLCEMGIICGEWERPESSTQMKLL